MSSKYIETQERIDNIFSRIEKEEYVSHMEKEFYCQLVVNSMDDYDKIPEMCRDQLFKILYLTYHQDLSFTSKYFKYNKGNLSPEDSIAAYREFKENNKGISDSKEYDETILEKNLQYTLKIGLTREVTNQEMMVEKEQLEKFYIEWLATIEKTNHKDQKLQVICKEAREFNKKIKKKHELGDITKGKKDYNMFLNVLKSKYVYLESLKIVEQIEENKQFPYLLKLNNQDVYFNYSSLIHILHRHYGSRVSPIYIADEKSFHHPTIHWQQIHLEIEKIFNKLNTFEKFKKEPIVDGKAYNFKYKGNNIQLYLKYFGDNKDMLQISSLYPIKNEEYEQTIKSAEPMKVDQELIWYKPTIPKGCLGAVTML